MFFGHFVLLVCNLLEWSLKVFQLVHSTPGLAFYCHIDVFRSERPLNSKTLSRILPQKFPIVYMLRYVTKPESCAIILCL